MRIKRMKARFGKLAGDSLSLGTGLNIIIGANEGGKSTWSGFIRTMLYGMCEDGKELYGGLSDRSRFTPWDGSRPEGEMVVQWGKDTIVLKRSDLDDEPFGEFTAVAESTGRYIQELSAINCGESLVGASMEVFLRSAFIGHGGNLAVHSAPDLERRMAALVSSGDEDVTYAQVEEALTSWIRRRRSGSNGLIPKLQEELEEVQANREKVGTNRESLNVLVKKEQSLQEKLQSLEEDLDIHRRLEKRDINERFVKVQLELEEVQAQYDNLLRQREKFTKIPGKARLLDLEDNMNEVLDMEPQIRQIEQAIRQVEDRLDDAISRGEDTRFPDMTTEEAMRQISTDLEEVEELELKLSKKANVYIKAIGFAMIGGFAVASGGFASAQHQSLFGLLGGASFVGLSAVGMMLGLSTNRRRQERLDETLAFYQVKHAGDMREVGNRYSAIQDEITTLNGQVEQSYGSLDTMRKKQRDSHETFLKDVKEFAPDISNVKAAGDAISRALRLEEQLKKAEDLLETKKSLHKELLEKGGDEPQTMEELVAPTRSFSELENEKVMTEKDWKEAKLEKEKLAEHQDLLGDVVSLEAREKSLLAQIERRKKELRALEIAKNALNRAYDQVQNHFYPELNRLAGDYFTRLTGGKYSSLSLTRELEAFTLKREEDPRSALALSQGTVDQIYLAVRLAVADLCLSKGELCPIVLDDALVSFDQVRMEYALDLLAEMGEHRQIILFTCHGREGKYMAKHPKAKVIAL